VVVVAAMAAVPGVASAQGNANITITNVAPASMAVPPGSVINLQVTMRTEDEKVESIGWVFARDKPRMPPGIRDNCKKFDPIGGQNNQSAATGTRTITVTAGKPGESLWLQAWKAGDCSEGQNTGSGHSEVHGVEVRITEPAGNPPLPQRCGLNVVLVLDESSSIAKVGATAQVQGAARAFVGALSGTGSHLAIVAFSRTARIGVEYDVVNRSSRPRFNKFIESTYDPAKSEPGTNWEGAFEQVKDLNETRPANLVVFVTDGNPNWTNAGAAPPDGSVEAMIPAMAAADFVKKEQGSRVFAVGVGPAMSNASSEARLTAISGNKKGPDPVTHDYTLDHNFDELPGTLANVATALCGGSVTVTKWTSPPGGTDYTRDNPDWEFTGKLTVSKGSHKWVEPTVTPPGASEAKATTDEDGKAMFKWSLNNAQAISTLDVTETTREHYQPVKAECEIHRGGESRSLPTSAPGIPRLELKADEWGTCEVYNQGPVATLEVVKQLIPSTDLGRFDLTIDKFAHVRNVGHNDTTGAVTVPVGDHFVSAQVATLARGALALSEYESTTECVSGNTVVVPKTTGAAAEVPVSTLGEHVVCTITSRRTSSEPETEIPGGPTFPKDPCSESTAPAPDCGGTDPPPTVPQTSLAVHKTMPAHAHVGHRVPVTITVRNVGQHPALNVTVHETPPGAGRIVRVTGHGATRHRDGTVTWSLGNLAPGAERTVHATMLATQAGSLRNTAIAGAANADVAVANAAVHAGKRTRAAPTPPPVTG
jgi:uncharacterized repeat protein (TIGR01451 family)